MTGAITPAPLDTGGLVRRSVELLRAHLWIYLATALVSAIPVALVRTFVQLRLPARPTVGQSLAALLLEAGLPFLILAPISAAAAAVATVDAVAGRRPSTARALEAVGIRFWPMAGALGLAAVAIITGFVLFVLPAILLAVVLLFAAQVAVVEGRAPMDALRRSALLVRGAWWRVFLPWLVMSLASTAVATAIVAIGGQLISPLSGDAAQWALGAVEIPALAAGLAVVNVAEAVLYLDRRLRLDGAWPAPGGFPGR